MVKRRKKKIVVAVSGGFDPVHSGHIRLFKAAKKLGSELVVILNNDNWLKKKKGFVFIEAKERKKILEAIKWVDKVFISRHGKNPRDMSVSKELEIIKPHIFANGGDRNEKDAANPQSSLYKDIATCKKLGIKMVFNVGGGKVQSSSWLLKKFLENNGKKQK
jgi:D-beta-D-heptose 7-phosphate kinase/D-beta-D-heptose 1-phosphate adenosyltransferase